ncbi:MAG: UDP-N-acetylmuramoyl-L-alanine--D-glutamate ligase [bacterium]|nr:UDP-N-acetylmuramoyl-L-alanine--D-glutamate ligase [bacterium]
MKHVAILGWGVDTQDIVPWLKRQGDRVSVLDEKEKPFGDLTKYDILVRSPGVYRYRPEILEAEKAGVVVTSKTKIFFDICPGKIIGVTGTKGKGTTSSLIFEILKSAGKDVYLAGNIGHGMFGFVDKLGLDSWVVLELSSLQLIDLTKSPHIGVLLMTTVDHLDWHKDQNEYVQAKSNLLRFQGPGDFAVVNKDYVQCRKMAQGWLGKKIWISGKDWKGVLRIRGNHHRENMAAAAAVAKIIGIKRPSVTQVAREFRGLEHRLEEVANIDGVTYFDDSISTVPETTIAAIKSFTEPVILIAGGSEKGSDFTVLGQEIAEAKSVKAVILVGLMASRIKQAIEAAGGRVKLLEGAKDMAEIVAQAREVAKRGDVVVLSPAAASFDMFTSYKDRGDQFKQQVKALQE